MQCVVWLVLALAALCQAAQQQCPADFDVPLQPEERYASKFPNPYKDTTKCGRCGFKSSICNPDHIITNEHANELDKIIDSIHNSTKCGCSKSVCLEKNTGYQIAIVLIDEMMTDKNEKSNLAKAEMYAYTLLRKWQLGKCDDSLIILYSQSDNVLYSMAGSTTNQVLNTDQIGDIAMKVRSKFWANEPEKIYLGLQEQLNSYREAFEGTYQFEEREQPQVAALTSGATNRSIGILATLLAVSTFIFL